ncbi:MAG: ral nucleoside transport system permease protein [Thermoleophilaceae bacterium]|nr:ral nucleoside transport system permease protein [Thermoleophilaceae bacterium]
MSATAEAPPAAPERRRWSRGNGITVEPRVRAPLALQALVSAGSVLGALLVAAALLAASGNAPLSVYESMVDSSFGTPLAFSQTLIQATPLILTSLAAAVAYRMRIWTIGADGQFLIGAVAASGIALKLGADAPALVVIVASLAAGALGGAAWAAIAGAGRGYLRTNEVISTLMLNFIALGFVSYLIFGSGSFWRDPTSATQPLGKPIATNAQLPGLFEFADIGILLAVGVAVLAWAALRWTRWAFELRVVGSAPRAARYAGIDVPRKILSVMCASGALAGVAGAIVVCNVTEALDPRGLDPGLGYGYTGIVVAALARLSVVGIVPVAILVAALLSAGPALELTGVPNAVVVVLQGLILLLVAAGQFFLVYRVRRV